MSTGKLKSRVKPALLFFDFGAFPNNLWVNWIKGFSFLSGSLMP
jgi:hypothetical protein